MSTSTATFPSTTSQPSGGVAVYIGRFQPFHNGHLALLTQALNTARHVVVVIGSAFQARTPRNPFTWQERAEMIRLALPAEAASRLSFLPVRDVYEEEAWVAMVMQEVTTLAATLGEGTALPAITLVGHFKDPTSDYLKRFAGWQLHALDRAGEVHASHLRDALFGSGGQALDATLSALSSHVPPSTLAFLRAWCALPFLAPLCAEWLALARYKTAWSAAPYPPVFVTVDAVVCCAGHVLLIRRGQPPGVGLHAVPGGFIEQRETACQSALRELREETRLGVPDDTLRSALKASAVFDHPDRSQRGRTITHAFHFDLGERALPGIEAADDARSAEWIPIGRLRDMEDQFLDDHFHMLDHFLGLKDRAAA